MPTCYLRLTLWVEGVWCRIESRPGGLIGNADPHPHPLELTEAVGEETGLGRVLKLLTMPCRHTTVFVPLVHSRTSCRQKPGCDKITLLLDMSVYVDINAVVINDLSLSAVSAYSSLVILFDEHLITRDVCVPCLTW